MAQDRPYVLAAALLTWCMWGCPPPAGTSGGDAGDVAEAAGWTLPEDLRWVLVTVLLDGEPAPQTRVVQGGAPWGWTTDEDGTTTVAVDMGIDGDIYLMASRPEARIGGAQIWPNSDTDEVTIELDTIDPADNEGYVFQDPGEPGRWDTTAQCGHCHRTTTTTWSESVHRTSAQNPAVQDLYGGVVAAVTDEEACAEVGGQWWTGLVPGKGTLTDRCYLGDGVLPALNPSCGTSDSCDQVATEYGACADCHAPGIDGVLGGRDLLSATERAYEFGVHCDVCHKVEDVDLNREAGVGGALRIHRPSEVSLSIALGPFKPLTFGPSHDVRNPRMGQSQRDLFHEARLCAGCHQQMQPVLVPGAEIDTARWPSGRLPIHTTYGEWQASPMADVAPCQSCHMPPDPLVTNHADQQLFQEASVGITAGWLREAGSARAHSWVGPRRRESGMLELAAALWMETTLEGDELTVRVTTRNVGPGHGIPTGEPMRSLVLVVTATCGLDALAATGGDAIPDFGGALERKEADEDWSKWPGAVAGQVVRVVTWTGDHYDYEGFGPFGDGTFDSAQKGMPVEHVVGEVPFVEGDDGVALGGPLPEGDVAYRAESSGYPADGDVARARAGAPGFAFARVLAGADARRMVPHFLAVDVVSDNRLMPGASWTSVHRFASPCAKPIARAALVHRAFPLPLARERQWELTESVMAEVAR